MEEKFNYMKFPEPDFHVLMGVLEAMTVDCAKTELAVKRDIPVT
jgi:hypothetical protein